MGHSAITAPLFEVRRLHSPSELTRPDLIAFTSMNGVIHHLFRPDWANVPVVAGGGATAAQARRCGYRHVRSAEGGVRELQCLVLKTRAVGDQLVHFGAKEVAGDLTEFLRHRGFEAIHQPVYETLPKRCEVTRSLLLERSPVDGIVVHSQKASRRLAELISDSNWQGSIFCLSEACAEDLRGLSGLSVSTAPEPTEQALMGLIKHSLAPRRSSFVAMRLRGFAHLSREPFKESLLSINDNGAPERPVS